MVSGNIQPLNSLGPMDGSQNAKVDEVNDPARQDYIKGRAQHSAGNYSEAALSFHNALKGFEEQGDEQGIANALDRIGDTCMAKEEYEIALENFKRSLTICEKEDDSFSALSLHKKMAACYRKLGRFTEALELLYDMIEHYQLTKNPKGVVEILLVTAEVYVQQGRISEAADAYRTISSIHANFKHQRLAKEFAGRADALVQE
ncbi:MAG TPA: tetratricopeptide repeat protein [Desulfobulbus sp.]|nr:tetratricopeptide repeat protein [Desulfobulbus sp.]HHD63811.1 tetratricopeptide repeat protein [Desulfobulbaceae bacterium]